MGAQSALGKTELEPKKARRVYGSIEEAREEPGAMGVAIKIKESSL